METWWRQGGCAGREVFVENPKVAGHLRWCRVAPPTEDFDGRPESVVATLLRSYCLGDERLGPTTTVGMVTQRKGASGAPVEHLVAMLGDQEARRLLTAAAEDHDDVARAVRLAAAGEDERLAVLRIEVDRTLRTRRHLDYWESNEWAADAAPVVDALSDAVAAGPSKDLMKLLERAAGHLVKVIGRADDSNGFIGELARRVLHLHRDACAAGVADPVPLARWMVRFSFEDQDFFEIDPVAYADALGDKGMAVYLREVAGRSGPVAEGPVVRVTSAPFPTFAARYAAERLAVLDRDVGRLVELLGGDLSSPHQFTRVAESMVELGRTDDALSWARRGIAETSGWQVAKLYDLAAGLLAEAGRASDVVELRRDQHGAAPSAATCAALQMAARVNDCWDDEVDAARAVLADRNRAGLIDALLADGDVDGAWDAATTGDVVPSASQWLRLAEAHERSHPADAMAVYLRLADGGLVTANKGAYRDAVRRLQAARRSAAAADRSSDFERHMSDVREQHRRRPSLIAMLDKAGLP